LLSLIFVQEVISSLKGSQVRVNCQEMGSFESSKCWVSEVFNEQGNRTWYALSQNQTPTRPLPLQTH